MNNSGKTLTILLVIIAVLLVCVTGISAFFFIKEIDLRKVAEQNLQEAQIAQAKLEGELKAAQQQAFLLEEKYKEAKENLENLQDDLELAQGVKQKMQEENKSLAEAMEKMKSEKEQLNARLSQADEQVASLKAELDAAQIQNKSLEEQMKTSVDNKVSNEVESTVAPIDAPQEDSPIEKAPIIITQEVGELTKNNVDLDKIIVAPGTQKQGKVISVDADTGFLIANLGEKDGVARGVILSDKFL